jgi:hypothetical protein
MIPIRSEKSDLAMALLLMNGDANCGVDLWQPLARGAID